MPVIECFLLAPDGNVEHVILCERAWGAIWHNGHRYESQHKHGKPQFFVRVACSDDDRGVALAHG